MFGLIAALAAVTQAPGAMDDPDVRCGVVVSVLIGRLPDDMTISAEDKAGFNSVLMYYFGKIDARFPELDYFKEFSTLLKSPDYTREKWRTDIERCRREVAGRAEIFVDVGKRLQESAP